MSYFFTADLHFDHSNIMRHCNRPFNSVEDMNIELIDQWNQTVHGRDIIVVAGDFTLHSDYDNVRYRFIRHLAGNIIWVKGNHDWWMKKAKIYRHIWHKMLPDLHQGVAVSHYPMRTWKNSSHGWWNLHGHSHGTLPPLHNQLDIGVDSAAVLLGKYRPFAFDEVKQFIKLREEDKEDVDTHVLGMF